MPGRENRTAPYKILSDANGNRYRFFCECSGMALVTTAPVRGGTPESELALAWESEGRQPFNRCGTCGKWVSDAMFNPDTSECVLCAPWAGPLVYCPRCGTRSPAADCFCRKCGVRLRLGRGGGRT